MGDMPDYHMYVVPVTVEVPPGKEAISDIGEFDLTPEDLEDGKRGPLLLDIKGRPYVIIYGVPEIDHYRIKGVTLKDPTIAASLPTSIENPAIAYDAVLDLFKCALYYNSTKIDPRSIRALTSADVVTVVQGTAANLKATVTQAEKDRTITSGNVTIQEPLSVDDGGGSLTVDGTVTVQQATRTSLKTQGEREDLAIKYFSNTFGAAGDYEILAAVVGQKHKIYAVNYESNANVEVGLRDGTSATFRYAVRTTSGVFVQTWVHPIVGSVYTALNLRAEGAVTVKGYVQYKTEA